MPEVNSNVMDDQKSCQSKGMPLGEWLVRTNLLVWLIISVAQTTFSAEVVVPFGAVWRWIKGTNEVSNPITAWQTNEFDDSGWLIGSAPFHYGENLSEGTLLSDMRSNYSCIFLRKQFVVTNAAQVSGVRLIANYDDGFVAWINGVEIARANVTNAVLRYTNTASAGHEAGTPEVFVVTNSPASFLRSGTNVLAVQAFNVSLSASSDFRFDAQLEIDIFDTATPVITNVFPPPDCVVGVLTQVTVWFNKGVTGVDEADLFVGGQPATGLIGVPGTNCYVFIFAQPQPGLITFSWDEAHGIVDLTGQPFDSTAPGSVWNYFVQDIDWPSLVQVTPMPGTEVKRLTQVEIWFNEPVQGVDASDLLVNGQPAVEVTGAEAGPYVFTFTEPVPGQVQFTWASNHGIHDYASNLFAGSNWVVLLNPGLSHAEVVISEFVAGNTTGLKDEDGDYSDWVEICNRSTITVNLLGWSLTDDPSVPGKWTFPEKVLNPGEYLIVFCSGKDRRALTGTNKLHTNFRLGLYGEYLGLYSPEYPRVAACEFTPSYPEQRNDFSYGLDSNGQWKYYKTPTPGAPNGTSDIVTVAPEPHFSIGRGLFDQPFNLLLTTTLPEGVIRYTLDGSEPSLQNGITYTGPIRITNTTVVRAAVFANSYLPSRVVTHSYIFLDSVPFQSKNPPGFTNSWGRNNPNFTSNNVPAPYYLGEGVIPAYYEMDWDPLRIDPTNPASPIDPEKFERLWKGLRDLPVVSIVMRYEDMFGPGGLYPTSSSGNKAPNEKPCSVEMLMQNGSTLFAVSAGIDLHGNASRDPHKNPKHGFKLNFRGEFGPSKLKCKLFEDSPVTEFDDLILRPDFNSSWRHWSDTAGNGNGAFQRSRASRTRDAWIKHTFRDMGHAASHTRYVHLFINGLYWGIYDFSEQPTKHFGAAYFGGTPDEYDAYDQGICKAGTTVAYNAMLSITNLVDNANYERIKQYLDITEFIDYTLLHFFVGHQDWGNNKNWHALRRRVSGPAGTFKYFPWDGECILLETNVNRVPNAGGSTDVPSGLFTKLDDNPQFRLDFADRVHKHMIARGGALTREANIARWNYWMGLLDNAIVAESCRWGAYRLKVHRYSEGTYQLYTREEHWLPEHFRMTNTYFAVRPEIVLSQLRSAGLYPTIDAPEFREGSLTGNIIGSGRVPVGFTLVMRNPNVSGTIYYTTNGADPRVYYSGLVSTNALVYTQPLVLTRTLTIKARVLSGGTWSALNEATFTVGEIGLPLRITEIMYNPPGGNAYEFIEIQNVGSAPLDIGGFSFQGIGFVFPAGTVIVPGQVLVLANNANPAEFAMRYPGVRVFGYYTGNLNNGGERIAILDRAGHVVIAVHYDDENGWPLAADGSEYSLEIIDPWGDPNAPANWQTSPVLYGRPGLAPSPPAASPVVINELMADNKTAVENEGTYPDWIELYNRSSGPVDISNWSLTDSSEPRKFVFPVGTVIPSGGYLVVWCDTATNLPGLHTGFALSKKGETVSLFDSNTNRVDAVTFGVQLTDYSVGRVGERWALTVPTPCSENRLATLVGQTNLVINEWLANAPLGSAGWIELYNKDPSFPVALQGIWIAVNDAMCRYQALSFIPPKGFIRLFADELPGAEHLGLKLPAEGGVIVLYDASANEVDRVVYGPQVEDVSEGRLPDGTTNVVKFIQSSSPEQSNYLGQWNGPVLNEVLARNSRAVLAPWSAYADFIELYNPTSTNFSLSGMALGRGQSAADKWFFPSGASIGPGGYLVIWCDGSRPASTTASAALNTGFKLLGEGGAVYLFDSVGNVVDSIAYGLQVEDMPIGRVNDQWQLLAKPTPGYSNAIPAPLGAATSLCINEWMAAPLTGEDWFEIYNRSELPVDVSGFYLTDDPSVAGIVKSPIPPLSFIGARKWVLFIADGNPSAGANHVNFKLDAKGETVRIYTPQTNLIDAVDFGLQTPGVSQGRLPDGADRIVDFVRTPTPGTANYLLLEKVIINEVLTHTDPPLEDAIELYNPSSEVVEIGGWYISDSLSDPKRFRIPMGTVIPPGGYVVFYQYQFGSTNGEDDEPPLFALNSAHGDSVYLFETDSTGNLTGRRVGVSFGPAPNGVSFGRFLTSVGEEFVLMSRRTFGVDNPRTPDEFRRGSGMPNAYPLVGPIVINEIMYAPPNFGTNNPDIEEFIELFNISDVAVPLYDPAYPTNTWRIDNAVKFSFAPGTVIPPRGILLVVPFDPLNNPAATAAFRVRYNTDAPLVGPYMGRLDNAGETIELLRPDTPQLPPHPDAGYVPYILVERISYLPISPWPTEAAGQGASLQRIVSENFGNDPMNWRAGLPTAGRINIKPPMGSVEMIGQDTIKLKFIVEPGLTYQLEYKDDLLDSVWIPVNPSVMVDSSEYIVEMSATNTPRRFYRLVLRP